MSRTSEFYVVRESRPFHKGDGDWSLPWKAYLLERKQDELKYIHSSPVGRNRDNPALLFAQDGCLVLHLSGSNSVCLL